MKSIGASLEAHYASGKQTIATCWKIVRTDAVTLAYTTHQEPLTVSGIVYQSIGSFERTTIESGIKLAGDSLSINGVLVAANVTQADIKAGKFDFAMFQIFEVNYQDLTMGINILRTGNLADISTSGIEFTAELRGLSDRLRNVVGKITLTSCDANLGDTRCGIDLSTLLNGRVPTSITSITNERLITCTSLTHVAGWFENGKVTMTSGLSVGYGSEVKQHQAGGVLTLKFSLPYTLAVGDTLTAEVGCLKRYLEDCKGKFLNGNRFRGFPKMPLMDKAFR